MNIEGVIRQYRKKIDRALDGYLPKEKEYPSVIHRAMRYSVFSGGKRIRPILALCACKAVGASEQKALSCACAIELIHAFSLMHDDLPALDDDDYRRGKLTCHKKFGEAIAILAGDALLNMAFGLLNSGTDFKTRSRAIAEATKAIGTYGMIGGQVVDITRAGKDLSLPELQYINTHKTGALIAASVKIGGIMGGASKSKLEKLQRYGENIGLAFQVIDDTMDNQGYARTFGEKQALVEAARLTEKAKKEAKKLGKNAQPLLELADFLLKRRI